MQKVVENPSEVPDWLTVGVTYLLPKRAETETATSEVQFHHLPADRLQSAVFHPGGKNRGTYLQQRNHVGGAEGLSERIVRNSSY